MPAIYATLQVEKLYVSKPRRICYYCGAPATSSEHVPPKQMFRKFLRRSIVVPSCKEHNNSKSGNDSAVIKGFLKALDLSQQKFPVEKDIAKAVDIAKPQFPQVKSTVTSGKISSSFDYEFAHIHSSVDISLWMRQLTAGLVYSALVRFEPKIEWGNAWVYSPFFVPSKEPVPLEDEYLISILNEGQAIADEADQQSWLLGWSSDYYPSNIYQFKIRFEPTGIVVRHRFYTKFDWFVIFQAPTEVVTQLLEKCTKESSA